MCVRNLNSYGCGCEYKEIHECGKRCPPEVGYNFIRGYDCHRCKAGGHQVTRGRDGQGRYAQAISRRENKEELQSVTGPVVDSRGQVTAWSQSPVERHGEKTWAKGSRRAADLAWEEEHDSRMGDICSRTEKMSMNSDSIPLPVPSPRSQHRRSPSPELYSSTDDDRRSRRSRSSRKPMYGEVMSVADITGSPSTRSRRRPTDHVSRSRYESQDSLDSIPKVTPGTTRSRGKYEFDPYDSGYGSRGSGRSHHGSGGRRSHYAYSTSPQSHVYQAPISGQAYGYPAGYYGVERTPISLPRYQTY